MKKKRVKISSLHKTLRKKGDLKVHNIYHGKKEIWSIGRSKNSESNRDFVNMNGYSCEGGVRQGWQLLSTSYIDRLLNKNIGKSIIDVEKIFNDRLKYVNKKLKTKVKLEDIIFKSIEEITSRENTLPDNEVFNYKLPYYNNGGVLEKYDSSTKLSTEQTKYNNSCRLLIRDSDYYYFKDGVYLFDYYVNTGDGVYLLPVYSCYSNFPPDEFIEVPNSPRIYTGKKRIVSAILHSNYCDIVDSNNRKLDRYERKLEEADSCKLAIINNKKYYKEEDDDGDQVKVKTLNQDVLFYDSKISELKKSNTNLMRKERHKLIKSPYYLSIYYNIEDLKKAKEHEDGRSN